MSDLINQDLTESLDIAVIGMAGRFPLAKNLEQFWQNLCGGVESIRSFTDDELKAMGVSAAALAHPNFVKAGSILEGVDLFDAAFFNYSPKEAEVLDPQQRIFLECAWEALERAGHDPEIYQNLIGVYAGTSLSSYLLFNLMNAPSLSAPEDTFQMMIGNDKDFLATRVSYELNLTGPSIDVQTGCSTSLVAVHLACQGLLSYHCDMALAGGVSVHVPQRAGYFYQEGGVNSPDGHCRAFDARAKGTVFGSGAGVVVLKRLSDALADGDIIHAVIKGSAINNDGSAKIGYTAPSIEGQSQVIAMAQAVAGIQPETITYIETHGTGTELGDPIEVAALTKAFGATDKRRFCAIGSVKTNIGHLDAAAGVAGFIKTVLALKHKKLPPSLHFQEPNPKIDFENGPFYVNAELSDWSDGDSLRRAGVSSFGIGGTNAHVIVEEPPPSQASGPSREWQLLLLSAKTGAALDQATANLVEFLKEHPATNIADAAYTLQCGRRGFNYRRAAICSDVDDAIEVLESRDPLRVFTSYHEPEDRHVIFMFPGGGAQYVGMGLDLYESEPVFAQAVDSCCETLKPHIGLDLKDILYPRPEREAQAAEMLKATAYALPALFTIEYSMAQLLISWGIAPHASIGHSLGEYVAACLAGVFTLEDALSLVVLRGQLFKHLPTGAMLAVALSEEELLPLLNGKLSLAAINAATQCVVSGSLEAINEMADLLESNEVEFKRLHIAAAGHSEMVTPILGEFAAFVRKLEMEAPAIQFVSNVTGAWITAAEATDPSYWARHLRQTVLFSKGLQELLKEPGRILLEVGPGQSLTTLAKMQTDEARGHAVIPTMRHPLDQQPGQALLLAALGKLWMAGAQIDWPSFYRGESRRRVELPAYAFERTRYWINPEAEDRPRRGQLDSKKPDISEWFYIQSWKRTIAPLAPKPEVLAGRQRTLLVFKDDLGLGEALIGKLEEGDRDVITVISGVKFDRIADRVFSVNPASAGDYRSLLNKLACIEKLPDQILHLWSLTPDAEAQPDKESFKECQERCFYSLVFLGQALAHQAIATPISIWVVTNGLYDVETGRVPRPEKATLLGPCKVIPQEMENITCRCVDIRAGEIHAGKLAEHLLAEIDAGSSEAMLAYRGNNRWSQHYEPVCLDADRAPASRIREDGVYLITGGLGGVGLLLARHLAGSAKARLALVGRSAFPPREDWDQWLAVHDEENELSRRIRKLMELEELGAQVMVFSADVASQTQMRDVVEQVTARFGALHGVIHAAGLAGEKALKLLPEVDRAECEKHFQAKVYGSYVLEKILAGKSLDFCLLISSNASILGGLGMTCYTSASTFLDAFAARRDQPAGTHWMSTTWDGWLLDDEATSASYKTSMDRYAMLPGESIEAFKRALSVDTENQIAISTGDLPARIDLWIKRKGAGLLSEPSQSDARPLHPRPELGTAYVAWSNDTERVIVEIWQELLGVERVGIHDNFFDLGGNSLVGLKVISGLKRELNVEIPVTALFEGPTVKSLAALISRDGHNQQSYTESRGRGERRREKRLKKSNRV